MATEQLYIGQNYSIDEILAELIQTGESQNDALLQLMPLTYSDTSMVVWEQPENGYGLLPLRGPGGEPSTTKPTGYRQYSMTPGYYGGKVVYDEREMTDARQPGTPNSVMDLDWLTTRAALHLAGMTMNQVRSIIADVLLTGRVTRRSDDGRLIHDAMIDGYAANQIFTAGVGWAADPTNAKPITDLLSWQNTLSQGTSTDFGPGSRLICQQSVVLDLLATTQVQTLYRLEYGQTINGLKDLNKLAGSFGLPQIEVYNKGYFPTVANAVSRARANFTRFLPVKRLIWEGVREDGAQKAMFQLTRNMTNKPPVGGSPDLRYKNPEMSDAGWKEGLWATADYRQLPPQYTVAMGFNGGPILRYGTSIAAITYA